MMGISLNEDRYYRKWIGLVQDALNCLDVNRDPNSGRISAQFLHLPASGGYYDQDEFIMDVWNRIRKFYIRALLDPEFINELRGKNKNG